MNYSDRYEVPHELIYSHCGVNILIGENGCGKSTLLNNIRKHYIQDRNNHVISIANTIYDKFDKSKSQKHKILRATQGKSIVKNTIFSALKLLAKENDKRLYSVAKILEYIGFNPSVGLRIRGGKEDFREKVSESLLSGYEKEDIFYFINRLDEDKVLDNILWINLYKFSFDDLLNSFCLIIFEYEKKLKKLGLIEDIELFLLKDDLVIPMNMASSGELSLIATLIYISTIITPNAIILIDEPENSLHPKWQIEYIEKLLDIFYLYQPKIIIATHSLLIIDGAENLSNNVFVFKGEHGRFELQRNNSSRNVEEIYHNYFDITTPENRYLSDFVVRQMNLLSLGQINILV